MFVWFIVFWIFIGCIIISSKMEDKKRAEEKAKFDALPEEEKNEILDKETSYIVGVYSGGLSKVAVQCNTVISATRVSEGLSVELDVDFVEGGIKYNIPYKDITSLEIKNEQEISKDVTVTRLLLTGVFAFALKKKRVVEENFCIIKYINKEEKEEMLVIKLIHNYNFNMFKNINGYIYKATM